MHPAADARERIDRGHDQRREERRERPAHSGSRRVIRPTAAGDSCLFGEECRDHKMGRCSYLHPGDRGYIPLAHLDCPHGPSCSHWKVGKCAFYHPDDGQKQHGERRSGADSGSRKSRRRSHSPDRQDSNKRHKSRDWEGDSHKSRKEPSPTRPVDQVPQPSPQGKGEQPGQKVPTQVDLADIESFLRSFT